MSGGQGGGKVQGLAPGPLGGGGQGGPWSTLGPDLAWRLALFLSSLHRLLSLDPSAADSAPKTVMFMRNVWVPELAVSLLLLLTSTFSCLCASLPHHRLLITDTFVLIAAEKLVIIGFNLHLIIFHVDLLRSTESALLLLPLLVFLLSMAESAVAVLYLDTVYFNIREWEAGIAGACRVRLPSCLATHHLLTTFLFQQFDTMSVHFTRSSYTWQIDN